MDSNKKITTSLASSHEYQLIGKYVCALLKELFPDQADNFQESLGNPPEEPKSEKLNFLIRMFCVRKSRFVDSQILAALKRVEAGLPAPEFFVGT